MGKWRGPEACDAGLGIVTVAAAELMVSAVVAVNAVGDIDDGEAATAVAAGGRVAVGGRSARIQHRDRCRGNERDTRQGRLLCRRARRSMVWLAVFPPHMRSDGDAFVAASVGSVDASVDQVRMLAVVAVETAIRRSVASLSGDPAPEVPSMIVCETASVDEAGRSRRRSPAWRPTVIVGARGRSRCRQDPFHSGVRACA